MPTLTKAPTVAASGLWADGGLTVDEAVKFTSLSRRTLWARIQAGEVPVSRVGRRVIIPKQHLIAMLSAGTTGAAK